MMVVVPHARPVTFGFSPLPDTVAMRSSWLVHCIFLLSAFAGSKIAVFVVYLFSPTFCEVYFIVTPVTGCVTVTRMVAFLPLPSFAVA